MSKILNNLSYACKAAFRSKDFWSWVIFSAGGALIATLVSQTVFFIAQRTPLLQGPGFGIAIALSAGLSLGVCQWFVLRTKFNRAYWWSVATAIGTVPFLFLQDSARSFSDVIFLQMLIAAICGGLTLGVAQWLFFVSKVRGAWLWMPVSMLAQFLSSLVLLTSISFDRNSQPSGLLLFELIAFTIGQILLGSAISACITGVPLVRFIEQKASHPK